MPCVDVQIARTRVFVYITNRWKVLWYTNFVPLTVVTMTIDDAILLLIIGFMVIAGIWLTALSYLLLKSKDTKKDSEKTAEIEEEPEAPEPPLEEKEEMEGLKEAPEAEDGVPEEGETEASEEEELKAPDTE